MKIGDSGRMSPLSIGAEQPETDAKALQSHRRIENRCHGAFDMTFRRDESRARDLAFSGNFDCLRGFDPGLLEQHPDIRGSLALKSSAGPRVSFLPLQRHPQRNDHVNAGRGGGPRSGEHRGERIRKEKPASP